MHRSDPTRPRRVIVTLAACQVWRLRQLVQESHEWFSRWFTLVNLTILPLPGAAGHRIQAVMIWELPPSKADIPISELLRDAVNDPRDLWRCEDLWVNEGV
jgi:hypothetical protein